MESFAIKISSKKNTHHHYPWHHRWQNVTANFKDRTDRVLAQLKNTKPYNASSLVVSINSRGGEPIQSHIIGLKLRSYAK